MFLKSTTPVFWVDDVRKTIDHYVTVYGFDENAYSEESGWGEVGKHDIRIMFSTPPPGSHWEGPRFSGSVYIETDGVDIWWGFLKERAEVVYPVADFPYGMREFAIRDCNGYLLQIGEKI